MCWQKFIWKQPGFIIIFFQKRGNDTFGVTLEYVEDPAIVNETTKGHCYCELGNKTLNQVDHYTKRMKACFFSRVIQSQYKRFYRFSDIR